MSRSEWTINVNRQELLRKIQANMEGHRAEFESALQGYRQELISILETRIQDIREGKKVDHWIKLPEPEDHTRDYKAAIAMVQMAQGDIIQISENKFRNFVLDEWDWTEQFKNTTANYSGKK